MTQDAVPVLRADTIPLCQKRGVTPVGRQTTITEAIAGQLIQLIMDGHYKSGSRLPTELQLARQFQAGRGAVREALKALALVGLVRVERGTGSFVGNRSSFLVRPLSLGLKAGTELHSLIEARKLIEVEMVGLAAERATAEEREAMGEYLDSMAKYTNVAQRNEFLEADVGFHFAIGQAAHNPILSQCLTLIRNLMHEWLSLTLLEPGVAGEALDEHHAIFEAIQKRRCAAARKILSDHLEISGERLLAAKEAKATQAQRDLAVANA